MYFYPSLFFLATLFTLKLYVLNAPCRPAKPTKEPVRVNPFAWRGATTHKNDEGSRPAVINMGSPASNPSNPAPMFYQPNYGQLDWQTQEAPAPENNTPPQEAVPESQEAAPAPQEQAPAAKVIHHHPYSPGYVRKRLQKIGVKTAPSYISDRQEIMNTDRKHSVITFPKKGPDHQVLKTQVLSSRQFNEGMVRDRMTQANRPEFLEQVTALDASETKVGHYYWHKTGDVTFCHTLDPWGYHWYGWYQGDKFFWTRYFAGRWWSYDSDYGRWCFWNDGFWWWQDPYHVGDLYCYNQDSYIPCNYANDTVMVSAEDQPGATKYLSPDKSRMVKVVGDSKDAFLYDDTDSGSASAIYLASGVQGVEFSSGQEGGALQIILKIADGSFDMFDGNGNPYNRGADDPAPDKVDP